MPVAPFEIRAARTTDVPALMRLKRALAEAENGTHVLRASEADWLRDGFGTHAGFSAYVADTVAGSTAGDGIVGMATWSKRAVTGWNGPVIFLQDLFVEPAYRESGVARALMARIATTAHEIGSPIIELTVRSDNPAQQFYLRAGFQPLPECLTYVLAGPALTALAQSDKPNLALAG